MINKTQNTNFGTKIIVSQKAYYAKPIGKLSGYGKSVEKPWTLKEAKFLNDEGFTDGISTCVAGIIKEKNGDNFYIFHFRPHENVNPWPKLKRGLRAALKRLRKGNPAAQLEGIMLGGKTHWAESKRQVDNLVRLFKKSRVNMTQLLLQPELGCCSFHYSLPKDEMTLRLDSFSLCQGSYLNQKDLGEHFQIISIKDKDSFEFGGAND